MYPGGNVLPGAFDVVITVRFSGIIQKTKKPDTDTDTDKDTDTESNYCASLYARFKSGFAFS